MLEEDPKRFTFDYSYWSHDGYEVLPDGKMVAKPGSNYADQQTVYNDLGKGVLDNAFQGYNCSLFAYGQTGSGKSYSMVGYGVNRGIVPITCDELFKAIESNKDEGKRFEVTFSMMEIYNEQVRDLLSKDKPKGGLQVRQNPKKGQFYVQGLKAVPVGSYREIEKRMEQGTASRTVASTNMNATSSRAHTVVTITFDQIEKKNNSETKKSSVLNLVDLAGSERADSTGATGDRLKEGANINKSLSALGNVISALADQSSGKKKNVVIPYRDSVLTKLLQNALGGNSKTIMIAALSPADINYDETLSTLRYADRAKQIKNRAVVNENPMDKLIRELKEENERLKKMMDSGQLPIQESGAKLTEKEIEEMRKKMEEEIREQLLANQQLLAANLNSGKSWEERLKEARDETATVIGEDERKSTVAHLINLNEDPLLSGVIYHYITTSPMTIGRSDADPKPAICLSGLSIMKKHAILSLGENDEYELKPAVSGAKTKVNGQPLTGAQILNHKDRILFGSNHMYLFMNPLKPDADEGLPAEITWEFAQKEIAEAKGYTTGLSGLSPEQQIAQEQVLEILPMVSEVNAISEELNKHRSFEVVLISSAAQEYGSNAGTKVMVKMKNLLNGNTWLWERGKFMNRRYLIQDLYQRFLDGDKSVLKIPKEEDPFWEPPEDVLIGTCNVFLQSLSYALDFDDRLIVTDFKGNEEGFMYVNVTPCTATGKLLDQDYFVDDPQELLGRPYHFKVTLKSAEVNNVRYSKGLYIKYRVYTDQNYIVTETITDTLTPKFNHTKLITFKEITQQHLDFFESGCITFLLYGLQEDTSQDHRLVKMTTKELRQLDQSGIRRRETDRRASISIEASETSQLKAELLLLTKRYERLEAKEKRMIELCAEWAKKDPSEQQFEPFHRAISAVANSTGTRLKTRVQVLNKSSKRKTVDKEDTVSLFVFGEEEANLENVASKNGGVINYDHLKELYGNGFSPHLVHAKQTANGTVSPVQSSSVNTARSSRACVVQ